MSDEPTKISEDEHTAADGRGEQSDQRREHSAPAQNSKVDVKTDGGVDDPAAK